MVKTLCVPRTSWFPRSSVGTRAGCMAHSEFPFTPCGVRGSVGARSRGFTLLEMLLVIFLMALVASAGLMLTEGVEDQAKYDETKRRMELIRKAIVGDPTRTVNGAPEISGFVADMGRLPGCLAELLELGDEVLPISSPRTFISPCNNAVTISEWAFDPSTGIGTGWRGPYLSVMSDHDSVKRFRDGYGNEDIDEDGAGTVDENDDALNFGWVWRMYEANGAETSNPDEAVLIRIKSKGFDGQEGNADDYPDESIDLVKPSDYQVNLNWLSITINFQNHGSAVQMIEPNELRLVLKYPDDGGIHVSEKVFPSANLTVPSSAFSIRVVQNETITVPAGTSLTGTSISFGNGDMIFNGGAGATIPVTEGMGAEVPNGSKLPEGTTTLEIGDSGYVTQLHSDAVTISTPFSELPNKMGYYSLAIVCDDPPERLFDGDCSNDEDDNGYKPLSQPYVLTAIPRGNPLFPPSPLIWDIQ